MKKTDKDPYLDLPIVIDDPLDSPIEGPKPVPVPLPVPANPATQSSDMATAPAPINRARPLGPMGAAMLRGGAPIGAQVMPRRPEGPLVSQVEGRRPMGQIPPMSFLHEGHVEAQIEGRPSRMDARVGGPQPMPYRPTDGQIEGFHHPEGQMERPPRPEGQMERPPHPEGQMERPPHPEGHVEAQVEGRPMAPHALSLHPQDRMRTQVEGRHGRALFPFHHHHDSDSDSGSDNSGSDSDSDSDREANDKNFHDHHPPRAPMVDTVFKGSLGFGDAGDMCMYQNVQSLSAPCQQAIMNQFILRQAYWEESQELSSGHPPCHGHGLMILLVLAALVLGCCLKRKHCKNRKQAMTILRAINANPSLKSAVEAEAGVSMPELPPPCIFERSAGEAASAPPARGPHLVCKILKCVVTAVLVIVLSFFLAIASIVITMSIIEGTAPTDENGNVMYPSPLAAHLLLFSISCLLSLIAALIFRGCRKANQQRRVSSEAPTAVTGNMRRPTQPGRNNGSRQPATRFAFVTDFFRRGNYTPAYVPVPQDASEHGASPLYAPLMHSNEGSEMVVVSAPPPPPASQHTAYPPSGPYLSGQYNGQTVYVPVSAHPMSTVTMI